MIELDYISSYNMVVFKDILKNCPKLFKDNSLKL